MFAGCRLGSILQGQSGHLHFECLNNRKLHIICTSINVRECESWSIDPSAWLRPHLPLPPADHLPGPGQTLQGRLQAGSWQWPVTAALQHQAGGADCRHRPAHCSTQLSSLRPGCCPLQHCSTADTAGQVNLPGLRDRHSRVWIIYHLTKTRKPTLYCLGSAQW